MAIAHLSTEDYLLIGQAFTEYITAHKKGSVPAEEWPTVLGPALFKRAVEGGYFGPKGTIPGLDYSVAPVKGVQVQIVNPDTGASYAVLYADGEEVAREDIIGDPNNFDTVAFAKDHGYDI